MSPFKKRKWRSACLCAAFLLIPVLFRASATCQTFIAARAWVGARIIDGTGKPAIENGTLLVRNSHITAVGKHVKVPAGTEIVDAMGKTIIPGLINAHGHVRRED